jgi:CheY-like chemotaxis protein
MKVQENNNGAKTILVVDDEEGVREIIVEIITELGYAVQPAESGEQALDLMDQTQVDLVISDLKMDGMDGLALARQLRERFPELPLALMTAFPNEDVHRAVEEKQVDFLLLKPFQMEELQGMVLNLAG